MNRATMDGATLSRFPHATWLHVTFSLRADRGPMCIHERHVTHSLSMTLSGQHSVRWIRRGNEETWTETAGTLHFRPCDREPQHFVIHSMVSGDMFAVFIPERHLLDVARTEGLEHRIQPKRLLIREDGVLRRCMLTLSPRHESDGEAAIRKDEAARRLVLRLVELSGGGSPDWHDDASTFDGRTFGHLLEYVDAHLKIPPSLSDMGIRVGLSPSHFAKKFRISTGLSLHRFINRRRIIASLESLKDPSKPLAHVAIELGFSSQAHFTHLFSGLSGMTPAKYRKLFMPTVG